MPLRLMSLDYDVPACDTTLTEFPILIGRGASSQIRLDDPSVSSRHCEIDYFNGRLIVRDLGTVHGTFVNGTRIGEAELQPGDQLAVGMLTFLVQRLGAAVVGRSPLEDGQDRQGRASKQPALAAS